MHLRHKESSDQVRNPKPPARGLGNKVNEFTADDKPSYSEAAQPYATVPLSADGEIPTMMMDFINAVKQMNGKGGGKGGGKMTVVVDRILPVEIQPAGRRRYLSSRAVFEGGSEDHQIKDCAERKRIIGADG